MQNVLCVNMSLCSVIYWVQPLVYMSFLFFIYFFKKRRDGFLHFFFFFFFFFLTNNEKYDGEVSLNNRAHF
jgi:hypothetical protein